MCVAIPLLPHIMDMSSWCGTYLSTGTTLPIISHYNKTTVLYTELIQVMNL
jgi:hypothetical protein